MCATVVPVTNAPAQLFGRPSISRSHFNATASIADVAGVTLMHAKSSVHERHGHSGSCYRAAILVLASTARIGFIVISLVRKPLSIVMSHSPFFGMAIEAL